jgi:trimeric autotransporter adhesin
MSRIRQLAGFVVLVCLLACAPPDRPGSGDGEPGGDDTASITLALTTVPMDVQCLQVTVTSGTRVINRSFTLTPGQAATVTATGLPSGSVTIEEAAYAVPCAQVTSTTAATWLSVMPVTTTLSPGTVVDVTIVLRRAGQVRITTDFQDGQFAVTPAMVAFGNVAVGVSASAGLTVTNTGATAGLVPPLTLTGVNAAEFSLQPAASPNPCTPTTMLAAGASCTTGVVFAPVSAGLKTAAVALGGVATGGVSLSGNGVAGTATSFSASPNPVAFGNVAVGGSVTTLVTVTNNGTANAVLPALAVTGTDATQFSVQQVTTGMPCPANVTLAPGGSCRTSVRFAPTSLGAKSATIALGNQPVALSLSGTGVSSAATFVATPNPLNFGNIPATQTAAATLTVTNTGNASGVVPPLVISGTNAAEFSVTAPAGAANPCTATTTLAAGAACTASVRFTPASTGAKTATLLLGMNAIGAVALLGTGTTNAAIFAPAPSSLPFGLTNVGTQSPINMLTITNVGGLSGTLPALSITGPNASEFQIAIPAGVANPCTPSITLPAGASCQTGVRFAPTSAGTNKTATLMIGGSGIPLSGMAAVFTASFSPAPSAVPFGQTVVGTTSVINSVTLTNNGMGAGTPMLSITGPNASEFQIAIPAGVANPCTATVVVQPGASCVTGIRFAPTSAGTNKTATLMIGGSGIPLTGMAVAASTSFSPAPSFVPFGEVPVGMTRINSVTLTNFGNTAGPLPALSITGPNANQFSIQVPAGVANPCTPTIVVQPNASCVTGIRFAPTSTGAKTANFVIGGPSIQTTGTGI